MSRSATAYIAAVLGGMGAVGAEVVFAQHFGWMLGVTAPAAATVVAVYMVGMALGASVGGRIADRLGARAGWLYVAAELGGAIATLAFLPLFAVADAASVGVSTAWTVPVGIAAAAVLVGPAAIASGATFPALTRLIGDEREVRRLYAANALGAAVGGLAAGLWLPEMIGLRGTLFVAAGCLVAAAATMVAVAVAGAPRRPAAVEPAGLAMPLGAAVVAYAVLGGVGMGAEIGWTRLLEQAGPNPGSLAFPVVLAAYLVGLSLGGLFVEPRLRRLGEARGLGVAAVIAGAGTLVGVVGLMVVPEESLLGHSVGAGPGSDLVFRATGMLVSADRLALYLAATFLPGLAAGAGFPIAVTAMARARNGLGVGVGLTSAAGIVAAVVVSLWMGFLPSFGPGVVRLSTTLGVAALVLGAVLLRSRVAAAVAVVGLAAYLVPPWAGLQIPPEERVLAFIESAAGPSAVAAGPKGWPMVYTHGERVPGLKLDLTVPLALHPDPANVLLIAFGTGVNVRQMLADPAVRRLDCVDIDPSLPRLAERLPMVGADLFADPRARYVADDGRHFLRQSTVAYDIVYSDVATYAQYLGLGTVEFFRLVRSRMATGGIFVVKLHVDTLVPRGLERFLATFLDVFPDAAMFAHAATPVLVGFTEPFDVDTVRVGSMRRYGRGVWKELAERVVATADDLRPLAVGPVLTDDKPMGLRNALVGPATLAAAPSSAVGVINELDALASAEASRRLLHREPAPRDAPRFQLVTMPARRAYLGPANPMPGEAPPPR